uniref:Uncharacterized protein n=1 Tax=Ditylum brightwellii TaxID=49249 RepID=A0A7S4RBN0_9STRA
MSTRVIILNLVQFDPILMHTVKYSTVHSVVRSNEEHNYKTNQLTHLIISTFFFPNFYIGYYSLLLLVHTEEAYHECYGQHSQIGFLILNATIQDQPNECPRGITHAKHSYFTVSTNTPPRVFGTMLWTMSLRSSSRG